MKNISGFFDKFKNRAVSEMLAYEKIAQILHKHTGIIYDLKDISISSGTLILKGSSLVKNEIFMKKSKILKEINENISNKTIVDIK